MATIANPPFRLKILKELTAKLKSITPENGFQNDLSDTEFEKKVQRGRLHLGDSEPDTMVTILEPPTSVEQVAQRASDNPVKSTEWDLLIQGWSKNSSGNEPCDEAYVLSAEVMQLLASEKLSIAGPQRGNYLLGFREIKDMKIGAPVVRPSEEISNYGVFYLILTLDFAEDMARPFG